MKGMSYALAAGAAIEEREKRRLEEGGEEEEFQFPEDEGSRGSKRARFDPLTDRANTLHQAMMKASAEFKEIKESWTSSSASVLAKHGMTLNGSRIALGDTECTIALCKTVEDEIRAACKTKEKEITAMIDRTCDALKRYTNIDSYVTKLLAPLRRSVSTTQLLALWEKLDESRQQELLASIAKS